MHLMLAARSPWTPPAAFGLVAPSQLTSQLETARDVKLRPALLIAALDHHTEAALAVMSEQVVQLLVYQRFQMMTTRGSWRRQRSRKAGASARAQALPVDL